MLLRTIEGQGERLIDRTFLVGEYDFGKEQSLEIRDRTLETVVKTEETAWESQLYFETGELRAWVRPKRLRSTVFDPEATTQSEIDYDYFSDERMNRLGLLASIHRKGYAQSPAQDHRLQTFDYYVRDNALSPPSPENPLLARKKQEILTSGNGAWPLKGPFTMTACVQHASAITIRG